MPTVLDLKVGVDDGSGELVFKENLVFIQTAAKFVYYVIADNLSQTFVDILLAPGIPSLGTPLYGALCSKVTPREVNRVIHFATGVPTSLWEVDVEFSTHVRDPDDTTPEVNWSSVVENEHLEFDILTGAPIVTAAGEPLFTTRPVPYSILKVRRLENYPFDPATIQFYAGSTNSQPFWGYPVGTGMMTGIDIEEDTIKNQRVCWGNYEIKFRVLWNFDGTMQSNTWQAHLLNQGYYVRPSIGAKAIVNRDGTGNPLKINLDLNGVALKDLMGTDLIIQGITTGPVNGYVLQSLSTLALESDIGGTIIISAGTGFTVGEYEVADVRTIGGISSWIVVTSPGTIGSSSGTWQMLRAPTYVDFNRSYPRNFNALSLGPF